MECDGWDDCIPLQNRAIYRRARLISAIQRGNTKRPVVIGLARTVASTTGRPWPGLVRHSSVLPLFHGHGNSGASLVSQNTSK